MMHYFEDMYVVLKEIKRVLSPKSKAYLILGDSAPYSVYIPTTEVLGKISRSVGFNNYEIYKIRSRGTKWKSLKNRHSIELSENVLVIK
jgi:DNA modification methylase